MGSMAGGSVEDGAAMEIEGGEVPVPSENLNPQSGVADPGKTASVTAEGNVRPSAVSPAVLPPRSPGLSVPAFDCISRGNDS